MVKILDVRIKIIDDKGHVKTLTKNDIDVESLISKIGNSKPEPKPAPPVKEAPPVEDPPVEPEKPKKSRHKKAKKP